MTERTFEGLRSVRPRPRGATPRLIVLHWTGGVVKPSVFDEDGDGLLSHVDDDDDGDGLPDRDDPDAEDCGSLEALYRVLRATTGPRTPDGLSVHVGVAPDGMKVQWARDELVTLHAGEVNPDALGLEGCSPGYSTSKAWAIEKARGIARREYVDRIRGSRVRMVDYTDAQMETIALQVERWCDRWRIPRRIPLELDGSLMRRQMTPEELAAYSGVMGHYHCHLTKNDPGTAPFLHLARRWGIVTG